MFHKYVLVVLCSLLVFVSRSQSIAYSEPDRNDVRNLGI